ncbi:MAG: nitroreductase/quinone reductase family protein [Thermomicrobiales bacterium]
MERFRRLAHVRRLINPIAVFVVGTIGLAPAGVMVLRVRRRMSGRMQAVPLNVLVHQGAYHLVSLEGESDWLRNLRAAGRASLVRGRTSVAVVVAEDVPVERRLPILRFYQQRWGGAVLGGDSSPDRLVSDEEWAKIVALVPVVRLKLSN